MSDREVVQLLEQCVYVAFIRQNENTEEVWCRDYMCIPLNAAASWWTDSDIIHVQVAFKVRLSGGSRCTPEDRYRTFSVDTKRKEVHYYDYKEFSHEFRWEFIKFILNKNVQKENRVISQVEAAYNFCYNSVGKPARIAGMLAIVFGGWSGNDDCYFCSEHVIRMFQSVGELKNVCPHKTDPGQLYAIMNYYTTVGKAVVVPHIMTWDNKQIVFN